MFFFNNKFPVVMKRAEISPILINNKDDMIKYNCRLCPVSILSVFSIVLGSNSSQTTD